MARHNARNERIKRRYFTYLREALGFSEATLDGIAKALHRFETFTAFRDFKTFDADQAIAFKKHLAAQRGQHSDLPLSKATLHSTLTVLKNFFFWLAGQPGFRSHLTYSDSAYFNLKAKDVRVAQTVREPRAPTVEQIRHVLASMPSKTEIGRRDRALVAFFFLSGARDGAVASLKLKHIDVEGGWVYQDAREVKTKFSKTITTFFFPVGDDVRQIIVDWVTYLRSEKLWGLEDPLFPATLTKIGTNLLFEASSLDRRTWQTAGPIRAIFRQAFANAGLPYFNPHSFRRTLAKLGQKRCRSFEQLKAWSQNLGHAHLGTTAIYGELSTSRQGELIRGLHLAADGLDLLSIRDQLLTMLPAIEHGLEQ